MKKIKIYLIIFIFILLITIFYVINNYSNEQEVEAKEIVKEEKIEKKKEKIIKYKVDIKGNINKPGVYEVKDGYRVIDVINLAGGLKDNSDTSIINLSKKVYDEMVIIIYTVDEINIYKEKLKQSTEIVKEKEKEIVCPDTINNACINTKNNSIKKDEKSEVVDKYPISINSATKEELMSVSGIGEGKAESIIKYREENGLFEKIEDIKNVSGIGDSLFEKIKEYITV